MTATDELRKMLDERGVEYRFNETTKIFEWHFEGTDGEGSAHATEVDGSINIIACSLTPEQAIAATLDTGTCRWEYPQGAGTCKNLANHQGCTEFVCSECGTHYLGFRFKYCPGCGAKVVEG